MTQKLQMLSKVCTSCGVERRKRGAIMYHPETFQAYCANAYLCNAAHPNSASNSVDRALELGKEHAEIRLLTEEEAAEAFNMRLMLNHPDPEKAERIRRMVNLPFTVRIGSPDRAEFLLDLQDELGLANITEAIRYCVDAVRKKMNIEPKRQAPVAVPQHVPEPEPEPVVSTSETEDTWTF